MRDYFVEDWKDVLLKAYSSWGILFTILLLHASDIVFMITGVDTNPATWTVLLTLFLVLTYVGRVLKQDEKTKTRRRVILITVIVIMGLFSSPSIAQEQDGLDITSGSYVSVMDDMTVKLVARWEGKRNHAYMDTIAKPPLVTICYGHTATAHMGMYKTDKECELLLRRELYIYRTRLNDTYMKPSTRKSLSQPRNAAFTSFAYNVGITGAGGSTAMRRLNNGEVKSACKALTWWNKAGGRVVRGLANRRKAEYAHCIREV